MEKSLKSRNSKKSRPKYAYTLSESGMVCTTLGDPIIFERPERYVCGACFLLLKIMDARCWLLLPSPEMRQMPPSQTIPFASSKCGCAHAYPEAQSLFIPELSPRGRIHFHGLLFNVPLSLGDTRKNRRVVEIGMERKTRVLAKLWGEGFVDAVKTDGSPKLGYYISKYITKGAGQTLFNAMRILRISHGFPKQIELNGWIAEELARRYAKKKLVAEWTGRNPFFGKITKKTYHQEP